MINPKDLIKTLSVEDLCQTAESYFKAINDPIALMRKPFNSTVEVPDMLQNMGCILAGLRLGKGMVVLEFAAGTCWFSRYLNQLQCQTISCDVSITALEIGKRLFSEYPIIGDLISEPLFLHFNGHTINLPSGSVDRIICHDGFHHVPNQDEVLSEFARVLKPGGIAGFCEPGRFHSQSPQSQYEMKNYKVLENDIILTEIFSAALQYGFTELKIRPQSDMELSLDDYQSLTENMPDPVLEGNILGNVRNVMINRTIFFLYKGAYIPDSRSHIGLSHSISAKKKVLSVRAGEDLFIPLKISNTGTAKWLNENIGGVGVVYIGMHLYDEHNNLLNLDLPWHIIESPIEPGQTFEQDVKVRFNNIGKFMISIDLVSERVCWFETTGSRPLSLQIIVS